MIQISQAQLDVFMARAEVDFLCKLGSQLRDRSPALFKGLSDGGMLDVCRAITERARGYGLTWESTLAGFAYLMADLSPNWDSDDKIHAQLSLQRVAADRVFGRLPGAMPPEAWTRAQTLASGAGWFLPVPLPWGATRARVSQALPAALRQAGPLSPNDAEHATDAGAHHARAAGVEGEDGIFLAAVAAARCGEAAMPSVLDAAGWPRSGAGTPVDAGSGQRAAGLRGWLREVAKLWV